MKLDARLKTLTALVRPGVCAADIGTDHGLVPVALVEAGRCPRVIATDLRPGPLGGARAFVHARGLEDRIDCRLGDGLAPLAPGEAQDLIIAGMGGETIAAILAACPWARDSALRFILQPMSRPEALRRYLADAGYTIIKEQAAVSAGHAYTVILARWTGECVPRDLAWEMAGALPDCGTPEAALCIQRAVDVLTARRRGVTDGETLRTLDEAIAALTPHTRSETKE